jgi:hypothetical protein
MLQDRRGVAVMSNMGSGGVFLKARDPLPVGEQVDLLLDWPAMLDGRRPLRLAIKGRILRSSACGSAVRILHYEYRLRSKATDAMAMAG